MKLASVALPIAMPPLGNRHTYKETPYVPDGAGAGEKGAQHMAEPATFAGNSATRADMGSLEIPSDGSEIRHADYSQGLNRALSVLAAHAERRPDHHGIHTALERVQRNLDRYVAAASDPAGPEATTPGIDLHA